MEDIKYLEKLNEYLEKSPEKTLRQIMSELDIEILDGKPEDIPSESRMSNFIEDLITFIANETNSLPRNYKTSYSTGGPDLWNYKNHELNGDIEYRFWLNNLECHTDLTNDEDYNTPDINVTGELDWNVHGIPLTKDFDYSVPLTTDGRGMGIRVWLDKTLAETIEETGCDIYEGVPYNILDYIDDGEIDFDLCEPGPDPDEEWDRK